jgi:hypothetical protein
MTVIPRPMSRLSGQVKRDRLQGTEALSLLSKSAIPHPHRQAWGRSGGEAAAAASLLKRVRPPARAGLGEGSPEAGWGQEGSAWVEPCNY